MKKGLFWLLGILLIMGAIIFLPIQSWQNSLSTRQDITEGFSDDSDPQSYSFQLFEKDGLQYVHLDEIQRKLSLDVTVDHQDGQVFLSDGKMKSSFIKEVAVVEKNGLYYPMPAPLLYRDQAIWIPIDTVAQILNGTVNTNGNQAVLVMNQTKSTPVQTTPVSLSQMTSEQLIEYLRFLGNPIKGARVSTKDSSLPGAPRTYRGGVHEGIDWYGGETTGVNITRNTPVLSVADGVVVRVDHDYQEMTHTEREQYLSLGKQNNGQTPQYVLDKLRGRSVWIQHEKGVMARYVHLDRIPNHLKVGQKVKKGDIIGYVGNSGTSDGVKGNDQGLHLHLDLFVYGQWFWDQYSLSERRMILEKVFPKNG